VRDMRPDEERRRAELVEALGSIEDTGHDWDADPAEWVRQQRRADDRRVGQARVWPARV